MQKMKWISTAFIAAVLMSLAVVNVSAVDFRRFNEREVREIARRNGYQYGFREGLNDRRDRDRFDYKRHRAYKDGKFGYRYDFGYERSYRDAFRDGFIVGYRNAFYNNNRDRWDDRWDDRRDRRNDRWDDRWDNRNRRGRNNIGNGYGIWWRGN